MCQVVELDRLLTAEEIAENKFSGWELICDDNGNLKGYRYYRWW